ncbi:I78 family peptidase inhibitor [Novosphingobium sp. ZN18A2]|uniref:I78 family peptidase inhibitor n=1 Tax=Novosphingobium sp. ZN18A2 TaxID=3079861 RepID=UPI0030CDEBDF
MIRTTFALAAATFALCGCASVNAEPARPHPKGMAENTCHADAAKRFIGRKASVETGVAMMQASGATSLRWVPPRTAVTMMYVSGRLTVSYDDNYVITRASCN